MAHAPDSAPGPRDDATNAPDGDGEHTNVTATQVKATDVKATDVKATDVKATDVRATDVKATDAHGTADTAGAPGDLKSSFRDALARKAGRNSHVEAHLDGRHIGGGNNDTHKRQFRRKSG